MKNKTSETQKPDFKASYAVDEEKQQLCFEVKKIKTGETKKACAIIKDKAFFDFVSLRFKDIIKAINFGCSTHCYDNEDPSKELHWFLDELLRRTETYKTFRNQLFSIGKTKNIKTPS